MSASVPGEAREVVQGAALAERAAAEPEAAVARVGRDSDSRVPGPAAAPLVRTDVAVAAAQVVEEEGAVLAAAVRAEEAVLAAVVRVEAAIVVVPAVRAPKGARPFTRAVPSATPRAGQSAEPATPQAVMVHGGPSRMAIRRSPLASAGCFSPPISQVVPGGGGPRGRRGNRLRLRWVGTNP